MIATVVKAEVNTNRGLDNSHFYAKTECNNCFIGYLKHYFVVSAKLCSLLSFSLRRL